MITQKKIMILGDSETAPFILKFQEVAVQRMNPED